MHTFEINMDPATARRCWNVRFRRAKMLYWPVAAIVLGFGVWVDLHDGDLDPVTIIMLSGFGLFVTLMIVGYVLGLRESLRRAREGGPCVYTLTDSTINLTDAQAATAINWTALAEIGNWGDFVDLRLKGGGGWSLPTSQVSAEALAYLVEQSRGHGAKITGF